MSLSENGLILTCKLKSGYTYTPGNQITVSISPGLAGANKNTFATAAEFSFVAIDKTDDYAPDIITLSAGIGKSYNTFDSDSYSVDVGEALTSRKLQRAKDELNIYIQAADKSSAGGSSEETNVSNVRIRTALVIGTDGKVISSPIIEKPTTEPYLLGSSFVNGITNSTGYGTIFGYDIGGGEDGLVRIDVAAVDNVGNANGFDEGSNNKYKSLFVVRDNTPPNIATEKEKVKLQSATAKYDWYNAETLKDVKAGLVNSSVKVEDGGANSALRAPSDAIKWAFTLGNASSSWIPEDTEWATANGADYPLNIASATEGASDVLMVLKDDLDNMSDVAKLDYTLNYDNTAPELKPLSWLDDSGKQVNVVTSVSSIDKYLAIPFTESLSGVREIDIKLGGNSVIGNNTEFFYSANGNFAEKISLGKRNGTNNGYSELKHTPVAGSRINGYTTGTLYVQNINIGSITEGEHEFSVMLKDAALNPTASAKTISAYYDITAPVLRKVVIPNAHRTKYYGQGGVWHYHFAEPELKPDGGGKTDIHLYITEKTSGLRTIDFSSSTIKPTASSTIKIDSTEITGFTVSSDGKITFANIGQIKANTEFVLEITNCNIENIAPAKTEVNTIKIKVTDFAGLDSAQVGAGTYSEGGADVTYSQILANMATPLAVAINSLEDRGNREGTAIKDYGIEIKAANGYTNYEVVDAAVAIPEKTAQSGATKKLVLSGASFVADGSTHNGNSNNTAVDISTDNGASFTAFADYTIDGNTIEFENAFATAVVLKFKNIRLAGGEGSNTVKARALAPTEKASDESTAKTIILDTAAPELSANGPFTDSTLGTEYPRLPEIYGLNTTAFGDSTASVNSDGNAIRYFYTAGDSRTLKISVTDSHSCGINMVSAAAPANVSAVLSGIENFSGITNRSVSGVCTIAPDATSNSYTYVAADAAGNISKAYSFYLIKDAVAQNVAVDKISPQGSATAHLFKNAANTTDHTITYIMKQATNEYKITVDLSGYAEKTKSATHSGLAQWAIVSGSASPVWQNYDSTDNIEYFINNVTDGEKLTLHLKDNCGNTTTIDIKDSGDSYANTILWTVDNVAPSVDSFYPLSTRTSLTEGTANASDAVYGSSFWKNVAGTTYYNNKTALAVKYNAETCLYQTANATEAATENYTVKARLYFTLDNTETVNANTFATATQRISPWYYFADVSGGRTFFVPYPERPEGTQGKLYLLLEDKVGNQSITPVTYKPDSSTLDKFVYINHPSRIVSGSSDYSESSIPIAAGDYYELGSTIYVNGIEGKVPDFDIDLEEYEPIRENVVNSGFDIYYLYSTDGSLDWASAKPADGIKIDSADNLSATFSKKVPVDLLDEAGTTGAEANSLYLYVRDVVGNNQKKQLGTGKKYLKDSKAPEAKGWAVNKSQSNSGNSNIKQIEDDGEIILEIMLAASSSYFNTQNTSEAPYTVLISKNWFTDNGGSDVKGLLESTYATLGSDLTDGDNFKLTIPYNTYKETGGTHKGTFYAYDNVGNKSTAFKYKTIVDSVPPNVSFELSSTSGLLYSESLTLSENNTKASIAETNSSNTVDTAPKIWSSDSSVKITVSANDTNGIASVKVDGSDASSTVTLSVTETESSHTVVVTDNAGNTTTLNFNLQLDEDVPTFTEAAAAPNTGARIKEVSGTKTLYYNSLALSAKISDGRGVGLDSYKEPGAAGYTGITAASIVDGKYSFTATENAGNAVKVYAKDKLKNENSVSAWKVRTETISAFVFDNTAPAWSAPPISVVRNGFVNVGNLKTWTDNTSSFVSYDSSTNKVLVKSNLDANIIITPSATDSSGVVGYIASSEATPIPTADSTTVYPTQFLLACGSEKTTGFVDTIKKAIPTGTVTTDANFNLKLAESESLTVYFFPIDYAGNVGAAQQVTFAYEKNIPVASDVSVGPAADSVIHQDANGINYFRGVSAASGAPNAATGEDVTGAQVTATITLKNAATFPLKGFKLVTPSGTELAHHTYAGQKSGNTFNLPFSFSSYSGSDDICIVFYNAAGDSEKTLLNYKDPGTNNVSAKWREDITAPNRPTAVTQVKSASDTGTLNDGSNGFYLNGTTLYYSGSAEKAYLNFTVTDNEENTSDIKGVGTSASLTASGTIANPYEVTPSGSGQTFYAYDNVLNVSATGLEITYVQDTAVPNITGVTVAGQSGSGYYRPDGTNTFYFNADSESAKKVTSITFEVDANDFSDPSNNSTTLSGIKSYKFVVGSTEKQNSVSNTFKIDSRDINYIGDTTVTVTVIDNVGNESTAKTFTLTPDKDAPTISVGTFKNGDAVILDSSENIHFETASANWRTASGGTVYFNRNNLSPVVTFKTDDADVETLTTAGSIDASGDTTSTVTATATDKVGNKSEFTVTFIADGTAPTLTHTGFYKDDDKHALEAKYYALVEESGKNVCYYNSNGRKAIPTFTASEATGASGLMNVYLGSDPLAFNASDSVYYPASVTDNAELTFIAKDNVGNQATYSITIKPDGDAPVISAPVLAGGAVGIHLDDTNNKLFYNNTNASRTGTLSFMVKDENGTNKSGPLVASGFMYSASVPASIAESDLKTTYSLAGTELTGAQNFYTADKVGNISAAYTLNFIEDSDPPNVSVAIGAKNASDAVLTSGYHDAGANFYFGSSVKKITFTVTADDKVDVDGTPTELSGVASYSYKVGDTPISETTSTLTIDAPSSQIDVKITVTDNVGNPTVKTIALVPDIRGPAIKIASFKNGENTVAIDSANVYIEGEPGAWADVAAASTVFFDGGVISSPNVAFSATDASGVDGDITLAYSSGTSIDKTGGETTTVTATATDKVGNTSSFAITFKSDTEKPEPPSINKITGAVGAALVNGEYYPTDYADWSSEPGFFKGTSGTIEFESSDGDSGLEGIYKDVSGELTALDNKEFIVNAADTSVTVVAVDNLGHQSDAVTFTVTPDNAAPTDITPTLGGTWYELKNASGVTQMYLYDADHATSPATISVAVTESSGIASYALKYGASAPTLADSDWTTTLALPASITTAENSYFWLWLKDNVGNPTTTATQIAKEGKPVAKYAAPTGLTYTYDGTANAQKITISGYPLYAGLKSIVLEADEFDTSTTATCTGINVNASPDNEMITLTIVDDSSNAITYMPSADIVIDLSPANLASITGLKVSVVDASGKSREIANAVAGASMFSRARAAVIGAADIVVAGAKKTGTSIANSVKSFFGVSSRPSVPAINKTDTNVVSSGISKESPTASNSVGGESLATVSTSEESLAVSEIVNSAPATIPNIKKESVARITYSTEESVEASISAQNATIQQSAPSVEDQNSASIWALIATCILASIVTISAVWVLKKKKNVL